MQDIRAQLLEAFDAEHREHLAAIRRELALVEHGQGGDMKDAFRRAHSLKGAARAVDLPAIEELAHRLEAVFTRMLDGSLVVDRAGARVIELGLDAVEAFAAEIAAGGAPRHPQAAIEALEDLLNGTAASDETAAIRPDQAAVVAPGAVEPAPRDAAPQGSLAAPQPQAEFLRVGADQVDSLSEDMHRLSDRLRAGADLLGELRAVQAELTSVARLMGAASARGAKPAEAKRRVEALSRNVGALVRGQTAATQSVDEQARRVRDRVDQLSLTPAETVFGGFGRMARDLARGEGRDVEVLVSGLDIQADRRVLQALKDPVMHLLRNALSHGAEDPEFRARAGKPPHQTVSLSFRSQGGRLHVSVQDDGRGPDLARIEAVAIERGLLPARPPYAPAPPADQLLGLVFEPQFSTAGKVDRLSGRGMGLSVVAEAARALHGDVLLRPAQPWGALAIISAPLMATRQTLLMARAGAREYGIPTHAIERLLRLPLAALESVEGRPAARIRMGARDITVPIIPLAGLAEGGEAQLPVEAGHVKAMLLRRGERRCAVAVDAFLDVQTVLVGPAPALARDDAMASGTVLLDGDRPALTLNPEALMDRWLGEHASASGGRFGLPDWTPAGARRQVTILVVDDSITTRTLEKSILEAQGYAVLLSVDGLDALSRLRSGEALVDLVIADVEMPRMDGFGLLQAIRTDPGLSAIPVILMTSRAAPEDVRRGLDLGARAYISKQNFDQRELLATIGQIL
ncbi:hybrid sensor histidine kinase/response regulator [Alsobacter metallidurans]|uniref:Chemotaxis protein CheA n=1 Tax=Alsobacter metallidurans TaxID=340221 RepID=A0A917I3T6_9HYPH|nr:response regulator [Alsobacter metallidurans]GGH06164.1 hybrid sensor histidine kinase/response regulator [Alsobacter metallidurans]